MKKFDVHFSIYSLFSLQIIDHKTVKVQLEFCGFVITIIVYFLLVPYMKKRVISMDVQYTLVGFMESGENQGHLECNSI